MSARKNFHCFLIFCVISGLYPVAAQVHLDTSSIKLSPDVPKEQITQIVLLTDSAFLMYRNSASLLDQEENKVTDASIRSFRSLFSNNAQVYNFLLKESSQTGMNISDYISLVLVRLEEEGVRFEVRQAKLTAIDFDAGGYYQSTVVLEMILFNGLDSKGKPRKYDEGRRFNVTIRYDIEIVRMNQASILSIIAQPLRSLSLDRIELTLQGGIAAYQGDLTPPGGTLSSFGWIQHTSGFSFSYRLDRRFKTRLGFQYAYLAGSDLESDDPARRIRNLSFFTNLFEFFAQQEVHLLEVLNLWPDFPVRPYVYGGLAVFRFNPKTVYLGEIYELQPLGTEGQGIESFPKPYARTQIAVPIGVGLRYNLSETLAVQLEFSARKLFTDYLDDVSGNYVDYNVLSEHSGYLAAALSDRSHQLLGRSPGTYDTRTTARGNPQNNDSYAFVTLGVSAKLSDLLKYVRSAR